MCQYNRDATDVVELIKKCFEAEFATLFFIQLIETAKANGEPTGVLKDAVMGLVFDVVPEPTTE